MTFSVFVEMDFSGTAFGSAPTWTDVTADVLTSSQTPGSSAITGSWGRQDWLGDVTATAISITLMNAAGKYTPGNTSSPYYPWVRYGTRCQIRIVSGGTTIIYAGGFATDWTATPANGTYWTSTVNFTDIYGLFSNSTQLRGYLTEECLLDTPTFLYPLQEDEGATSFGDITGQNAPAIIGNSKYGSSVVTAATSPTGNFVAGNVVFFDNLDYSNSTPAAHPPASWLSIPVPAFTGAWSFETCVQMPTMLPANGGSAVACMLSMYTNPGSGGATGSLINLDVGPTGYFQLVIEDGAGGTVNPTTGNLPGLFDGNVHQFAFTLASDLKTARLYIDGAVAATDVAAAPLAQLFTGAPIVLAVPYLNVSSSFIPFQGGFAFAGLYPTQLSTARVLAHYNAGANAFQGERTDTHVSRLLTYRTNYGLVFDAGLGFVGSEDITGETMQTALSDTSTAEGGVLYADGLQKIIFRNRAVTFNPTVKATVDVSQGQLDVPTTFRDDVQNVVNDITVSRPNGSDQRAFNASSIAQVGEYTQSITANVDTDQHALDIANWELAQGIQDQTASPTLTFDLYALVAKGSTALVTSLLQLRPLDVVMTTNNLPQAPAPSMQMVVQGGSFSISSEAMSLELYTTPLQTPVVTADPTAPQIAAGDTADSANYVSAY